MLEPGGKGAAGKVEDLHPTRVKIRVMRMNRFMASPLADQVKVVFIYIMITLPA
jgi:hypothetical protein